MGERTVEELKKENDGLKRVCEDQYNITRVRKQFYSIAFLMLIITLVTAFLWFWVIGERAVVEKMALSSFWIAILTVFFEIGSRIVYLYIFWHFAFATYHLWRDEIDALAGQIYARLTRAIDTLNEPIKEKPQ